MASNLQSIDLTGATTGQQFNMDFPQFVTVDPRNMSTASVRFYNESGAGLGAVTNSGYEFRIPAGAWPTINIGPKDTHVTFTVSYVLPNAPVSILEATYYQPGEDIPPAPPLGNSPIGVTGAVSTSSVQTLSNEGGPSNTQVIDIGDSVLTQLFRLFASGRCVWSVDQSGTAHQVLNIQTTGNPLQLGQSGDSVEVLGKFVCDNFLYTNTIADNIVGNDQIDLAAAGVTFNNLDIHNAGIKLGLGGTGDFIQAGDSTQNIIDCTSATEIFINPPSNAAGHFVNFATANVNRFRIGDGGPGLQNGSALTMLVGSLDRMTGSLNETCGAGTTITHGLGTTPFNLVATPNIAQAGSATVGIGAIGATTFRATVGAGTQLSWWAKH